MYHWYTNQTLQYPENIQNYWKHNVWNSGQDHDECFDNQSYYDPAGSDAGDFYCGPKPAVGISCSFINLTESKTIEAVGMSLYAFSDSYSDGEYWVNCSEDDKLGGDITFIFNNSGTARKNLSAEGLNQACQLIYYCAGKCSAGNDLCPVYEFTAIEKASGPADVDAPLLYDLSCLGCESPVTNNISRDQTPTFIITCVDEANNCTNVRLQNATNSYDDMGDLRNCTNTGDGVFTCILPESDKLYSNMSSYIYFTATDDQGNSHTLPNATIRITMEDIIPPYFVEDVHNVTQTNSSIYVNATMNEMGTVIIQWYYFENWTLAGTFTNAESYVTNKSYNITDLNENTTYYINFTHDDVDLNRNWSNVTVHTPYFGNTTYNVTDPENETTFGSSTMGKFNPDIIRNEKNDFWLNLGLFVKSYPYHIIAVIVIFYFFSIRRKR